jgi:hypothetical protein
MMELYFLGKWANQLQTAGRKKAASIVLKSKSQRSKFILCRVHRKGLVNLAAPLVKAFGIDRLAQKIAQVDLNLCRQIRYGSKEYKAIIQNPFLLPELDETN